MVKGPWHRGDYWRDKSIAGEGRWELLLFGPLTQLVRVAHS